MNLSEHFTLIELCKSQTAERLGIDNQPDAGIIDLLAGMCDSVLEPVRAHFGVPFSPSSAYRSEALNKVIGGSATSAHCAGLAVDIEVPGFSNLELAHWVVDNLVSDQVILECYTGQPDSGWVHVGQNLLEPRGEVLTYTRGKGYMNGLPS